MLIFRSLALLIFRSLSHLLSSLLILSPSVLLSSHSVLLSSLHRTPPRRRYVRKKSKTGARQVCSRRAPLAVSRDSFFLFVQNRACHFFFLNKTRHGENRTYYWPCFVKDDQVRACFICYICFVSYTSFISYIFLDPSSGFCFGGCLEGVLTPPVVCVGLEMLSV